MRHQKAESVTGIQIIMSSFKSIQHLLFLVCFLQLIQFHGVVSRQTYITSYSLDYYNRVITFNCTDDIQKNIVSELLTSGYSNIGGVTRVKFAHCEWATLPDAERQLLSKFLFGELDLSAIALESSTVDDLKNTDSSPY